MRGSGSAGFGAGKAGVVAVVAVWLLTTLLWLTPGLTRPDGAGYYAYLPSTYFDRDLLFFDEWAEVRLIHDGRILFKDVTETGHLSNHWTAGASLAWYPAFVAADLVARGDGFQVLYVAAVAFTSAIAGLFVLLAGFRLSGNALATIAIWLGSPLAFYSLRHATMSHAISAAACAAVVLLSLRLRQRTDEGPPAGRRGRQHWLPKAERTPLAQSAVRAQTSAAGHAGPPEAPGRSSVLGEMLAVGMAIGFACATRPQNIVIGLVPLLLAPAAMKRAHVILLGALIAALPQLIVSQTLWGAPLAFVNIGGRAHPWQMFSTFRPFETLFSWYHGLATWTPLLVLAIAGLFFLRDKALARAGLITFAAQWLLLSVLERWFWGGASFGQRRFDSCTIFFILGLAALLERVPRWLGIAVTAACTAWTMLLFIAVPRLNLNAYQTPSELLAAFRAAGPEWRTFLGYTPPPLRMDVLLGMGVAAIALALIAVAARKYGTRLALAYFLAMSAFFAWCGTHPKHDTFSRHLLATPMPSGSALDTMTLLRYEADYMERTGRTAEAQKARAEAERYGVR
ncbi:MAG TPA: hypothetical protein VE974_01720 [Thermoanaerobaculia bacterium]|nr:hypothetical protein [Thermoanaerobaculia bacterium]